MRLVQELRSHLQYKIILPFLLLTLLVALAGSAVSFLFIVGSAQERLSNQLAQVARATSDSLVNQESANLVFLREVAFAPANPHNGAPAVADALAAGNRAGLEQALDPYFRISTERGQVRVDRLIAFDTTSRSIVDWERSYDDTGELSRDQAGSPVRVTHAPRHIGALWFVPRLLTGQADDLGDKYAGLLDLSEGDSRYLFTAAPVVDGDRVVGGLIIATRIDTLLQDLNARAQAAITTLYRAEDGSAFASTIAPVAGLSTLNVRPDLVPPIRQLQTVQQQGLFDSAAVNGREYQFAYAPLRVRGDVVGLLSVALASDYVTGPWAAARMPLTILTVSLMLTIIGLGIFIARQITRPLQELVATAEAVTGGDLGRRSPVTVGDEIGLLSRSFNTMTAHLLDLYVAVRAEASQRAAIVESITDGVVVCDPVGQVLVINRAMRALLGLTDEQQCPGRFEDIPLRPLGEAAPAFGESRGADLFNLADRVVRVAVAPVLADDGARLGDVYVLQDLTSEVAMDRAKTNFIATISHELRTPLTVMGGSADLLLRNLVGPLNDEQRMMIEAVGKSTQTMTSLLNNVITIAGLESGTLTIDVEPLSLSDVLDEVLWTVRKPIATKGLELSVSIPDDVPEILADFHQLRNVLQQLLDNARRYTLAGSISIRAQLQDDTVRVDVTDTGPGISPELSEQLFTRFTRGAEGINSAERGIGLGLAIARQLIERQGGRIWLESTSDRGSTFSFSLPCAHSDSRHRDSHLATAA